MTLKNEEQSEDQLIKGIPKDNTITFRNVQFTYIGAGNEPALSNINLVIPCNKTTAIVGTSGSGKTTLIKLLLKFYNPDKGEIVIGDTNGSSTKLNSISHKFWRKNVGVVMQDGYIFNDTIAKNIAVADDTPDLEKLTQACKIANILDFIESLPLGFNTKIGTEGNGISTGQKQRIIIARAVYRNPVFLFFDEATNALDANNEKVIVENLSAFFKNRTVIVVAHRLSTVRNADNIIVLENAKLVEQGTHNDLVALKAKYYDLVKNQLELGA
jgi:ATP-binding cassette subfamily B protein